MSIRLIGAGFASIVAGIFLFNAANSDWQRAIALGLIVAGIAAIVIGILTIGGSGSNRGR